jgi:hypothetical protein
MQRHARKTQDIELGPRLGRVLAELRRVHGIETDLELDVDRVRDVEAVIGGEIPDPWLAVLASSVPALEHDLQFQLSEIAAHTKAAHQFPVQRDLVALGRDGTSLFVGFVRGRDADRIAVYDSDRKSLKPDDLTGWLLRRFELDEASLPDSPALTLRLVRHVLPTDDGKPRVRHAKWGEGLVLAEHGEGPTRKVKADFPGLGLKVVQARFLEFLD